MPRHLLPLRTLPFAAEFGPYVLEFHTDTIVVVNGFKVEVATLASPYAARHVADLRIIQPEVDLAVLWHPELRPRLVKRFADHRWLLRTFPLRSAR